MRSISTRGRRIIAWPCGCAAHSAAVRAIAPHICSCASAVLELLGVDAPHGPADHLRIVGIGVGDPEHPTRPGGQMLERPVQVHPPSVAALVGSNQRAIEPRRKPLPRPPRAGSAKPMRLAAARRTSTAYPLVGPVERRGCGTARGQRARRGLTDREGSREHRIATRDRHGGGGVREPDLGQQLGDLRRPLHRAISSRPTGPDPSRARARRGATRDPQPAAPPQRSDAGCAPWSAAAGRGAAT